MQAVSLARPGAVVLGTCVAIAGVAVLVLALASETLAVWIAVLATAVVALSILANARFHVRVDSDGLFLVSAVGWPRVQVPIAEVVSAEVVDVAPMAEFGGWGMRWAADRRFGVVLRAGEGILVRRTDGRSVTVTVDDAATGAGLLNAYAALTRDRARD